MKVRWRIWLWALLLVPILIGAVRLRFDVEVLNLLPIESRTVAGLKLYQQNFSNARELLISVRGATPEEAEGGAKAIAENLRTRTNLVADVTWQPPWLEHPEQAFELAGYLWLNQPPEVFAALTHRLAGTNLQQTLLDTREQLATSLSPGEIARLSRDPFNLLKVPGITSSQGLFEEDQDMFAAEEGTFRLIFVQAATDLRSYAACRQWLHQIKQVVARVPVPPEVVVRYTGRPVFVAEIAGGMEHDINSSIGSTLLIIALLFWWAHRTWRPLLWLITLLTVLLGATLALGGLILGTLNVVSAGFAAILLGLAVDYGLVLYQEHRSAPEKSAALIRQAAGSGILWSAVTTAAAFLVLNLGGLPGLGQLGTLVGLGIGLAAVVMLYGFLPPLLRAEQRLTSDLRPLRNFGAIPANRLAWFGTVFLILLVSGLLLWRPPVLNHSPEPLRPRKSTAYDALDEIRTQMKRQAEPLWLVVAGDSEQAVANRLDRVLPKLQAARASGAIQEFTLPAALWPHPEFQAANRGTVLGLLQRRHELNLAASAQGFLPESMSATEGLFDTWQRASTAAKVFWPTNRVSRWVLSKFTARNNGQWLALGLIYPAAGNTAASSTSLKWADELSGDGIWLAGWSLLGVAILEIVQRDLWRVLVPLMILLLISLGFAFKRISEMLLSLAALTLSGGCLLALMSVAGWSWNLLNLMAIPLLLGTGVDYGIHMQLALRRHSGNVALVRHIIGRALLLCAGTTVAGFGSLAWSSNAGLASLGKVCASGVGLTFFISTALLPTWWRSFHEGQLSKPGDPPHSSPPSGNSPCNATPHPSPRRDQPSSLYRTTLWRLGQWTATHCPSAVIGALGQISAHLYWACNSARRDVVRRNLLPAFGGEDLKTEAAVRELFSQFARKVVHLWRYETGLPIQHLITHLQGWHNFITAQKSGRGILVLTVHLGNWEIGAPLLAEQGIKLAVVTLQEPETRLTQLRQASRAHWGIETLVIGENPFAFIDVIRRLEAGGAVALLVDRPPRSSAVEVELFGRPFPASIAAAELARASGCVLLPVCVTWAGKGYRAQVLPEIAYDRANLGSRAARQALTQQIMRAFEPVIRQYSTQWYHFVSIWPGK